MHRKLPFAKEYIEISYSYVWYSNFIDIDKNELTNGWQILSHVDTKKIATTLAVHEDEDFDTFLILVFEDFLAQKISFGLSLDLEIIQ